MGFTLEDIGTQADYEKTLQKLQSYHKELLNKINTEYENTKTHIDNHFKNLI